MATTGPQQIYRIGFSGGGYAVLSASGKAARWNTNGVPILYGAEHHATALLELLVHFPAGPPSYPVGAGMAMAAQYYRSGLILPGATYEVPALTGVLNDWDGPWLPVPPWTNAQKFGEDWYNSKRSLYLRVPSVVSRPDWNIIINPDHPDYASKIHWDKEQPVEWDGRLFKSASMSTSSAAGGGAPPPGAGTP